MDRLLTVPDDRNQTVVALFLGHRSFFR